MDIKLGGSGGMPLRKIFTFICVKYAIELFSEQNLSDSYSVAS